MGVPVAPLRRSHLAGLLLLAAGAILLRAPFFGVPMITDEGGYAYVARFWTPDYQLYRDIPFDRPQGIFVLYRLALWLIGGDVVSIRLFAALYNALAVIALWALCRRTLSNAQAWLGATMFALFSASPRIEGFTANAETFLLLPLIVAALLTWERQWFWAGVAGGLAVTIKANGIVAWLLTLCWIGVTGAGMGAAVRLAAGAAAGILPSVVHGAWIGWSSYWDSVLGRRLMVYTPDTMAMSAQRTAIVNGVLLTVSSWAFLAVGTLMAPWRSRSRETLFGGLWLACSVLAVAMGGWWREHYFILLVPSLAFTASMGLARLRTIPHRSAWASALVLAAVVFVRDDVTLAFRAPHAISWELYKRPAYLVAMPVADYIRSQTASDETIYVAFAEAEIYYLAERRGAAPQFYFLDAQFSQHVFDSVIDAIKAGKPSIVVLVNDPPPNRMSRADFLELLATKYAPGKVFSAVGVPAATLFHRK